MACEPNPMELKPQSHQNPCNLDNDWKVVPDKAKVPKSLKSQGFRTPPWTTARLRRAQLSTSTENQCIDSQFAMSIPNHPFYALPSMQIQLGKTTCHEELSTTPSAIISQRPLHSASPKNQTHCHRHRYRNHCLVPAACGRCSQSIPETSSQTRRNPYAHHHLVPTACGELRRTSSKHPNPTNCTHMPITSQCPRHVRNVTDNKKLKDQLRNLDIQEFIAG